MSYVTIDGEKYEKELVDLAKAHTTGQGEGKISKAEAAEIIASAKDGKTVTDTEHKTLKYIRSTFEFTDAAAAQFDEALETL